MASRDINPPQKGGPRQTGVAEGRWGVYSAALQLGVRTSGVQATHVYSRRWRHTEVMPDPDALLQRLASEEARSQRLTHVERIPARGETAVEWPSWLHPEVQAAFEQHGIAKPWSHQVELAELGHK